MSWIALLRAVNVGGTGRLAMSELRSICAAAGLREVRTYIASGNAVFRSGLAEAAIKAALEARLQAHAGRPVGVTLRTAAAMAGILARNPFPDAPGNRVMAIFLDEPAASSHLAGLSGLGDEEAVRIGQRELYVLYGRGMADTTLRLPAAAHGTARNMNTVAKLAEMAADP